MTILLFVVPIYLPVNYQIAMDNLTVAHSRMIFMDFFTHKGIAQPAMFQPEGELIGAQETYSHDH
jgi:hypothetical protein